MVETLEMGRFCRIIPVGLGSSRGFCNAITRCKRREESQSQGRRYEHGNRESEVGPGAKKCWQLPEAVRQEAVSLLEPPERTLPCTCVLDVRAPEPYDN